MAEMAETNKDIVPIRASEDLRGKALVQIIEKLFVVDDEVIRRILAEANGNELIMLDALVEKKLLTSQEAAQILAAHLGLGYLEAIEVEDIADELLNEIPISFAKHNRLLPIGFSDDDRVLVACSNPLLLDCEEELRLAFGKDVELVVTSFESILTAINSAYDRSMRQAETAVAELEGEEAGDLRGALEDEVVDLLDMESDDEAPIIRLVNSLLSQAVKDGASDIHVEPYERELVVRFRVDGVLYEIIRPPKRFQNSIISRVKIMGGLNIAEKRLPQDGRIRLKVAGRDFDIRVSSVPTTYGERIVMRLLDRTSAMRDLAEIGFSPYNLKRMDQLIHRSEEHTSELQSQR